MKIFKPLLFVSLSIFLISCGSQKPMVKDIKVTPHYVDSDLYVGLSAELSLGNVTLPAASFPIYLPKTWEEIGMVSMQTSGNGQNLMSLDINLSAIAHLNTQVATLPNGSMLPLIGTNRTIAIPIDNKVELYVTIGDGQVALGVAIPFKTLDGLGSKVGTTSLFPFFNINKILGSAGIYTSKTAGKNGFGLFADITAVMDPIMFIDLGQQLQQQQQVDAPLNYSSIAPSSRKERKINNELYKLHSRRTRLRLN